MLETILFKVLPYVSLSVAVAYTIYRLRTAPPSSPPPPDFLEHQDAVWGPFPWHLCIFVILMIHIVVFLVPEVWQSLMSHHALLMVTETIGLALAVICLLGLLVLAARRFSAMEKTSGIDLLVIVALLMQVGFGAVFALNCRWGALWCGGTTSPYIWSVLSFHPDLSYLKVLPTLAKSHIVGGFILLLVLPFSKILIHMFVVPVEYLLRRPASAQLAADQPLAAEEVRRSFVRAFLGIAFGSFLLALGTCTKIFYFFFGPRLSLKDETELMELKIQRLGQTVDQRKLELQREESDYILVSACSDLDATLGKYFIDYEMKPAIAFKGKDGLPLLISAKCTHLGCTVGNKVDDKGKILCPCHVSYFDIETGEPNADAPAKAPLPHIGWVVKDEHGKVLASRDDKGKTTGTVAPEALASAKVYIAKNQEEKA